MQKPVGDFIRKRRKEAKLTLKEVSDGAGISYPYLSTLETGKRDNPSAEVLKKIADVLGIPTIEILALAGYLNQSDTAVENSTTKEKEKLNLYKRSPLEMLLKLTPDTIEHILVSYVQKAGLKRHRDELFLPTGETLKRISSKEYVDAVVIRHQELLHIYVFMMAIIECTRKKVSEKSIWKLAEDLGAGNEPDDESGVKIGFEEFGIWYRAYFNSGVLKDYDKYELNNNSADVFDITPVFSGKTALLNGKVLNRQVVNSIRLLLKDL